MRPIFDSWDLSYKSIFGAVRQFETLRFTIRLPKDVKPDFPPVLVLFRTGFKERFINMNDAEEEEDCIAYSADYNARYADVHYYYFSYSQGGIRHYIKKVSAHTASLDHGDLFQLTVYKKSYQTPNFLKGGVMYQIFPDRFFNSGKPKENVPGDRVIRENWGETPWYRPDEHGRVWNNDYFGGDLAGITEKLDYLAGLGVTCLYLNPVFEAHENHRYNTADYMKIDPLLGANEDFEELCSEAEKRGISVILDGVFSHTGADSVYFNKYGRYPEPGAYQSRESRYYDWYYFIDYPNVYESWWGIDALPNVNENNDDFTDFICGDEGVLRYWLEKGAAGFRLDVADELPDLFLDNLRKSVKSYDKEKIVIGEVWEDASHKESYGVKRRYLLGDQLDSVMNYPFREAILNFAAGSNACDLINAVMTIVENYPKPTIDTLMNFISTHDVERAINRLGGESCYGKSKDWMAERYLTEEEYALGKKRLKTAMALQFFLPGVPCVYYGDEAGLQGYKDPFNRRCFPWGKEDAELVEYVSELSRVRKSIPNLKYGKIYFVANDGDYIDERITAFTRQGVETDYIFFINRSDDVVTLPKISGYLGLFTDFEPFLGKYEDDDIVIEPHGYTIVKAKFAPAR